MIHFMPEPHQPDIWIVQEGAINSYVVGHIQLFHEGMSPLAFFKTHDNDIPGPTVRDLLTIAKGMRKIEQGELKRFCLESADSRILNEK